MSGENPYGFEKPIVELENRIAELAARNGDGDPQIAAEIKKLKRQCQKLKKEVYANLTPWQRVQVARHPDRPQTADYVRLIFDDFMELCGDRCFKDDRAVMTGLARIGGHRVMVAGHQKGRTTKEKVACYFGCAHPEGYRKALLKMKLAEKFNIPIVTLIDTPGAYPGIGAEERGQAQAIATNLFEMSRLAVPIVCVVIGEGGSGGALGIGVGDVMGILENAYLSVISPEGCAAILWKSGEYAPAAAEALKLTAESLAANGLVDEVIPEPPGGAHRNAREAAKYVKRFIVKELRALGGLSREELLERRYGRLRSVGVFAENVRSETESGQ